MTIHNKEKYPEIFSAKEKAEKELEGLMLSRRLETDKIALLASEIEQLELKKNELNIQAMGDFKRIKSLRNDIKSFAIAMGAAQG